MNNKLKIIELLDRNRNGIHLRGISRAIKTGLPNIVRYIKIMEKEGVIINFKDANAIKVKLNENIKTVSYLKQINTEKFLELPKKVQIAINDFTGELTIKPLILLIFGSYAKKNYSENSDIDILLVFQKVEKEKEIENIAKRISMRTNAKISPIYVNYENFEKNFLDKNHDFSREIREDVIILSGIELYCSLLWRFLR